MASHKKTVKIPSATTLSRISLFRQTFGVDYDGTQTVDISSEKRYALAYYFGDGDGTWNYLTGSFAYIYGYFSGTIADDSWYNQYHFFAVFELDSQDKRVLMVPHCNVSQEMYRAMNGDASNPNGVTLRDLASLIKDDTDDMVERALGSFSE